MDPTVTRQRAGALNLWRFAVLLGATFRQTAEPSIAAAAINCSILDDAAAILAMLSE